MSEHEGPIYGPPITKEVAKAMREQAALEEAKRRKERINKVGNRTLADVKEYYRPLPKYEDGVSAHHLLNYATRGELLIPALETIARHMNAVGSNTTGCEIDEVTASNAIQLLVAQEINRVRRNTPNKRELLKEKSLLLAEDSIVTNADIRMVMVYYHHELTKVPDEKRPFATMLDIADRAILIELEGRAKYDGEDDFTPRRGRRPGIRTQT